MSDLAGDLEAILMRAMADGASVVPVEVLFDLLGHGPREVEQHEIVFPGSTHTWMMRHPKGCTDVVCAHASAARRQFPAADPTYSPGTYTAELAATGGHLITTPTAKGN